MALNDFIVNCIVLEISRFSRQVHDTEISRFSRPVHDTNLKIRASRSSETAFSDIYIFIQNI